MKTKLLYLIFIINITIVFIGCNKDKDNFVPDIIQASINIENNNVYPYETIKISVTGISLSDDSYSGFIGNVSIKAIKEDAQTLYIFIPYISSGTYDINVSIHGNELSASLIVKAQPTLSNYENIITDAQTIFDNMVADLQASAAVHGQTLGQQDIELINNLSSTFKNLVNQMSDAEKLQLAHFFNLNGSMFETLNFDNSKGIADKLEQYKSYFAKKSAIVLLAGSSFALSLTAPDPTLVTKAIAVGSAILFVKHLKELKNFVVELYNDEVIPSESDLLNGSKTDFVFSHNEQTIFDIKVNYRTIYKNDISSTHPLLSSIVSSLNIFQTWWVKFDNTLITLKEIFGFSEGGLTGRPAELIQLNTYSAELLSAQASNANISNISNSNVSVNIVQTGSQLKVKFTSTQNQNQSFNFKYNYIEKGFTLSKNYTAVLEKDNDTTVIQKMMLYGPWKTQTYYNDSEFGNYYLVFSFIGVNCQCFNIKRYDDNTHMQIGGGWSMCLEEGVNQNTFKIDEDCPVNPFEHVVMQVMQISNTILQLKLIEPDGGDVDIYNCTAFN